MRRLFSIVLVFLFRFLKKKKIDEPKIIPKLKMIPIWTSLRIESWSNANCLNFATSCKNVNELEALRNLKAKNNPELALAIVENENAHPETLDWIILNNYSGYWEDKIAKAVANHPNISNKTLKFLFDNGYEVYVANRKIHKNNKFVPSGLQIQTATAVKLASESEDINVLRFLAAFANEADAIAENLVNNEASDREVIKWVAQAKSCLMLKNVRDALMKHRFLDSAILDCLYDSPYTTDQERFKIERHPDFVKRIILDNTSDNPYRQ